MKNEQLWSLLSEQHSLLERQNLFRTLQDQVDVMEDDAFVGVKNRALTKLGAGITPTKRKQRYDSDLDSDTNVGAEGMDAEAIISPMGTWGRRRMQ